MPSLNEVIASLRAIAPLELAAEWDNVGLLIEPTPPVGESATVTHVLLTIDLTEAVLDEAVEHRANLVVAYHPPIFRGLKRLTSSSTEGRLALRAIEARLPVYSPHTALDAVVGGVNDWLAEALGPGARRPVEVLPGTPEGTGFGRWIDLDQPVALGAALAMIKRHLGIAQLRVAATSRHQAGVLLRRVAVCAGAGGSLLSGISGADLIVTGEMRHHDVRELVSRETSVVLCDHTNTERGYLVRLADTLRERWEGLAVTVAQRDRDPLAIA